MNAQSEDRGQILDTLIVGGRVMDPASSTDAVLAVGIRDGKIVSIGDSGQPARRTIDATNLVVAPGFIDMHSHAQSPVGLGFQALDGVTTALDLESGTLPVAMQYQVAEREGRPINFGYSASWAVARMFQMDNVPLPVEVPGGRPMTALEVFQRNQTRPGWSGVASRREVDAILDVLAQGIAEGAIGIGVLLGYSPGSGREEYFNVARLAESLGVPVFTHSRQMSNVEPGSSIDGALEIIAAAAGSGAAMHMCHINATSLRRIDEVAGAVEIAQVRGNRITTEAYPYGIASTGIGAAFLDPDRLDRMGIEPAQITYLPTGERVRDRTELRALRLSDPGGLCLFDFLDEGSPKDLELLLTSFRLPGTVVASDALPMVDNAGNYLHADWSEVAEARVHPRSIGTFGKTLGWLVRDLGALSLNEAISKCSTEPAELLRPFVPAMNTKGRVVIGFDADLTIFDPKTVTDKATGMVLAPSVGFMHVLVNGISVVYDGKLDRTSMPGRPLRGSGLKLR
ncbi:amidohydrolase family protein [Arthrobacter sp. RHLT1-20]